MFATGSLIASIIEGEEYRMTNREEEVRAGGIELHRRQLGNISVDLYDCPAQVDFQGMHEVFLSPKALFLLVWDITNCSELSDKVGHWSKVVNMMPCRLVFNDRILGMR